ncbi:coiled-coil and C2 domain-containing protein 1B-like isoform X1 [Hoplias malabaricus]|uniref:coiled-coil and C2 domain-containing protein 1B-like isoform X1 n=1 Tax=Hoplias malabaricus TaxID=27720 RepID=UPI00346265DB
MFGRKNKQAPRPKGQGAAAAKQMGLFLDFNPDEMMDMNPDVNDPDLEAEFAAIVGKKPAAKGKKGAKAPLPMEDIEKMTEACMKDIDDDYDDDNLEDDEDLLAELQEVVGDEEAEDSGAEIQTSPSNEETHSPAPAKQEVKVCAAVGSVEHTLEERVLMYKAAINNTKASGESSKARRYERGLKTLQGMLSSVRKGGKINEAEIPPPVASGAPAAGKTPELDSPEQHVESDSALETSPVSMETASISMETASVSMETVSASVSMEPVANIEEQPSSAASPDEELKSGTPESVAAPEEVVEKERTKEMLLESQREYRMAALKAKQAGDIEKAKLHIKASKGFDAVIEALEKGQRVDLNSLPPSPSAAAAALVKEAPSPPAGKVPPAVSEGQVPEAPVSQSGPVQPKTVLEALEQRFAKYKEACVQAKASGDERKARMHDRIAKQYQGAIRSHKAGRPVNYDELPVPPGFPPIPGQQAAAPEQGLAAVLEAANKLASNEADAGDDDEEEEGEKKETKDTKPPDPDSQKKPTMAVLPTVQHPKRSPSPSPDRTAKKENLSATAVQQLEFLEGRKKQYMKAALAAKQKNDMEQAKIFLRTAKSFEPMIEAAKSGKAVDISKVPSPPGEEDEDFVVVHHSEVQMSEKSEEVYTQLNKILKEQYEKCMTFSKQFTHTGNIAETTKFEKMAERCKKSLEILKLSQNRGLEPPKHHFEERTYRTVRIFPELSSTDMVVTIVRGMNLPAPHGVSSNDLDAFVKFDFPYPSSDQPQKHKTAVIKNTNSPEYNQSFTLNINRNHRGFRRVVQSKGLKLEIFHKGGFLRSDKPVGTALLKLEKLETESEVREIVEVMDGRKPSGGRLEVKVRLREPLSGQDVQAVTERWLVLDQSQGAL